MRSITLLPAFAIAISLASCSPKPPATLAEVVALVAVSDWEGAETAVESMAMGQAEGCKLAMGHALRAGLSSADAVAAVEEPLPELQDYLKARFWRGYEDAISPVNELGDCNLRSLNESELEIGG